MKWRRVTFYLVLNLLVSAGATLGVLVLWDRFRQPIVIPPTPGNDSAPASQPTTAAEAPAAVAPSAGPLPTVTPTIHVVEAGDTLGSIALAYDVSLEEILAANNLTNPDVLSVGQALIIPVGGLPAATPTPEPLGGGGVDLTPIPTATEAAAGALPNLAIRAVEDPGVYDSEQVVIVNLGGAVQLGGWRLTAADGSTYIFPALRLHENGQVTVHSAVGQNTVTDLYWGQPVAVWAAGETVELVDPQGDVHATLIVP